MWGEVLEEQEVQEGMEEGGRKFGRDLRRGRRRYGKERLGLGKRGEGRGRTVRTRRRGRTWLSESHHL